MSAICLHLFNAIENNNKNIDEGSLSELVQLLSSTKQRSAQIDFIKSSKFHKQHAHRLFSGIIPLLRHVLESECYVPLSALADNEDGTEEPSVSRMNSEFSQEEVVPDAESTEALLFLKYTAIISQAYISALTSRRASKKGLGATVKHEFHILEEVFTVVELLHDSLFELHSCGVEGTNVQRAIASCCEAYWDGEFIDREVIVTSLVPLLVLRSLDGNATKADIKRLWNVREMLSLLDFEDESIAYIRSLLLRTVSSPLYTKNPEGRRMVGHLFQLDRSLVKDLHQAIRAQICMAKGKSLEAYGDIYFRAWKESIECAKRDVSFSDGDDDDDDDDDDDEANDIRSAIEDHALQDLMYASLHAASPHMAKAMRTVLEPFYSRKNNPEVDLLLFRMYSPILWRSLAAANPLVRIHASSVLATTFPLRDPTAGKLHLKGVNDKSVEALMTLMNDVDPKVRVAGCDGTVRILGVYWDALSSRNIRTLLNQIVMRHANDTTASIVRAQAVNGISLLLDAKASHGVLRPLLPYIGNLIHDRVERVRLVTVKLLLKLKKMRGFKYYHIVGRDHLLARLAAEGIGEKGRYGPVADALTNLLANSYLPQGVKGSEQIRRSLLFLTEDPKAAQTFYSNIAFHLDITVVSKLIGMLVKTLKIAVDRDVKEMGKGQSRIDIASERFQLDSIIASNTRLMSGISQTIYTLLAAIGDCLNEPGNEKCLEFVQSAMKGTTIIDLCAHFQAKIDSNSDDCDKNECHHICASLLNCVSFVPPTSRSPLFSQFADRLTCNGDTKQPKDWNRMNIIPYLAVFCSWKMQDEVAMSLSKSISSYFVGDEEVRLDHFTPPSSSVKSGRRKRKQGEMDESSQRASIIPEIPGHIAVLIIAQILSGRDSSSLAVRDAFAASENASSLIGNALEKATVAAEHIISRTVISCASYDIESVLSAFESFGCYAIHKEAFNGGYLKMNYQASALLEWITCRAIPSVISKANGRASCSPFHDLNLSRISIAGAHCADSPAPLSPIGVAPPRRRSNLGTPTKIDSSFVDMENQGDMEFRLGSKGSLDVHSMFISLINSALSVFSDWITVGGDGAKEIVKHVIEWKCIFDCDFGYIDAHTELFPAYCKFSAIVANYHKQFDLLMVAFKISGTQGAESGAIRCISDAVAFLTCQKHRHSNTAALLDMGLELIEDDFKKNADEKPETLDGFFRCQTPGIGCIFHSILSFSEGIEAFAEALLGRMVGKSHYSSLYEDLLVLLDQEYLRGKTSTLIRDFISTSVAPDKTDPFQRIIDNMEMKVN